MVLYQALYRDDVASSHFILFYGSNDEVAINKAHAHAHRENLRLVSVTKITDDPGGKRIAYYPI